MAVNINDHVSWLLYFKQCGVPGLSAGDLEDQSFYELLGKRFGIGLNHSVQTIEPTLLDAVEAKALGVPAQSPALLFERTSRGADDVPFEFVRSVYRGDRYKIRTELTVPDRIGGQQA